MDLGETLRTASNILTNDRAKEYGDPNDTFSIAAKLLRIVQVSKFNLHPEFIDLNQFLVWSMICVKLARELKSHKSDNLVDLAAYCDILNRMLEEYNKCPSQKR